jgi:hypothetical protein
MAAPTANNAGFAAIKTPFNNANVRTNPPTARIAGPIVAVANANPTINFLIVGFILLNAEIARVAMSTNGRNAD